jgi:hypothetical protein
VHVHEIIDQTLRFAGGFQLDDAQAALDEIAKVGPGGSFLSAPSTPSLGISHPPFEGPGRNEVPAERSCCGLTLKPT